MIAIKKNRSLSRRTFLRGASATVLSLPLLECMLDDHGTAFADGSALPCRYLSFFCPTALVGSGGAADDGTTPTRTGFDYDLKTVLSPLADLGVAGSVSAVSGLFAPPWDAPGGYDSDYHGLATAAIASGVRQGFEGEDWIPRGPSADQVAADAFAGLTRFDSLVYRIDPNGGPSAVSIRRQPDGGYWYTEPQTSPARAYGNLFSSFSPADPEPADDLEERLRVSSLSHVRDQIGELSTRLGRADRQRLELHLEQVRTLENRLAAAGPAMAGVGCRDPMLPASDPPDVSSTVPDQQARASLFIDVIQMALACDLSRSISISGTNMLTGAGMMHEQWSSIGGLHADVQHSSTQGDVEDANRWFVRQYATLLSRLQEVSEGTGTVLDRTAAVFMMEGGNGGRGADGGGDPNHSTDNMLVLIGGRAGGLRAGQHIVERDVHPTVAFNTALRAVGVDHQMGEVSGVFDRLF